MVEDLEFIAGCFEQFGEFRVAGFQLVIGLFYPSNVGRMHGFHLSLCAGGVDKRWWGLFSGASLWPGGCDSVGEAAGPDEECGVGVHAVFGTGGESFDAPFADEGFPGAGFGEALLFADAFHDVHELGHGGDVGHEYSAGDEELFGDGEAFPGFEHVEEDPVDGLAVEVVEGGGAEVAEAGVPVGWAGAEVLVDVVFGVFEVVGADFVGDDLAGVPYCSEE